MTSSNRLYIQRAWAIYEQRIQLFEGGDHGDDDKHKYENVNNKDHNSTSTLVLLLLTWCWWRRFCCCCCYCCCYRWWWGDVDDGAEDDDGVDSIAVAAVYGDIDGSASYDAVGNGDDDHYAAAVCGDFDGGGDDYDVAAVDNDGDDNGKLLMAMLLLIIRWKKDMSRDKGKLLLKPAQITPCSSPCGG